MDRVYTRHNAPHTSHAAAESMRSHIGAIKARVLEHIRSCGECGCTSDEAELALGLSHQTCSARFRDLSSGPDARIQVSGKHPTRPTRSGRKALVWVAV